MQATPLRGTSGLLFLFIWSIGNYSFCLRFETCRGQEFWIMSNQFWLKSNKNRKVSNQADSVWFSESGYCKVHFLLTNSTSTVHDSHNTIKYINGGKNMCKLNKYGYNVYSTYLQCVISMWQITQVRNSWLVPFSIALWSAWPTLDPVRQQLLRVQFQFCWPNGNLIWWTTDLFLSHAN